MEGVTKNSLILKASDLLTEMLLKHGTKIYKENSALFSANVNNILTTIGTYYEIPIGEFSKKLIKSLLLKIVNNVLPKQRGPTPIDGKKTIENRLSDPQKQEITEIETHLEAAFAKHSEGTVNTNNIEHPYTLMNILHALLYYQLHDISKGNQAGKEQRMTRSTNMINKIIADLSKRTTLPTDLDEITFDNTELTTFFKKAHEKMKEDYSIQTDPSIVGSETVDTDISTSAGSDIANLKDLDIKLTKQGLFTDETILNIIESSDLAKIFESSDPTAQVALAKIKEDIKKDPHFRHFDEDGTLTSIAATSIKNFIRAKMSFLITYGKTQQILKTALKNFDLENEDIDLDLSNEDIDLVLNYYKKNNQNLQNIIKNLRNSDPSDMEKEIKDIINKEKAIVTAPDVSYQTTNEQLQHELSINGYTPEQIDRVMTYNTDNQLSDNEMLQRLKNDPERTIRAIDIILRPDVPSKMGGNVDPVPPALVPAPAQPVPAPPAVVPAPAPPAPAPPEVTPVDPFTQIYNQRQNLLQSTLSNTQQISFSQQNLPSSMISGLDTHPNINYLQFGRRQMDTEGTKNSMNRTTLGTGIIKA